MITDEPFQCFFPLQVRCGFGAISELGEAVALCKIQKLLCITDRGITAAGITDKVTKVLNDAGIKHAVFDDTQVNPTDKNVEAARAMWNSEGCDGLLGLGGGSPIDTAKAVRILAAQGGSISEYDAAAGGMDKIKLNAIPMIAIPTTSGTGSEVTLFAVVTDTARNIKMAIGSPFIVPSVAIVDPELTLGLPADQTAATGLDVLSHAVEAYTSTSANPLTDALAMKATALVRAYLETAYTEPTNREARMGMSMASTIAGLAFSNALVGACHSLAHQLSTEAGIAHGIANALMLPAVMSYNLDHATERLADIAHALGVPASGDAKADAVAGINEVRELNRKMNVPQNLSAAGIERSSLGRIAKQALADICHLTNPRPCDEASLLALYEQVFG